MIPCVGCSRFIRSDARQCPFCEEAQRQTPSPLRPAVTSVLLGLTLAACGGDSTGDDGASASASATATATASTTATVTEGNSTTAAMDGPGMTGMDSTSSTGPAATTGPGPSEAAVAAYGGPDVDTMPPDEDTAVDDATTGTDSGTDTGTGGTTGSSSAG